LQRPLGRTLGVNEESLEEEDKALPMGNDEIKWDGEPQSAEVGVEQTNDEASKT
jgi:hypothetical protein